MRIIKKIKKLRGNKDGGFVGWWECEHCGRREERTGQDHPDFYHLVVPSLRCSACKRRTRPR